MATRLSFKHAGQALGAGLVLVTAIALAGGNGPVNVGASLSGFQEVPAVVTTGNGHFSARIDRANQQIDWTLRYDSLKGNVLFAHIHLGNAGTNGGVIATLCSNTTGAPQICPVSPATISGTIFPADVAGPAGQGIDPGDFDSMVVAIEAGATYINVHTDKFLGGEIRGQVKPGKRNKK
jgi:hypothetical protein